MTPTPADLTAAIARMEADFAAAWDTMLARIARTNGQPNPDRLTPVDTGSGIGVIPSHVSYGHADVDDVLAGTAIPTMIVATEDGRSAAILWHDTDRDGPIAPAESWVYVERWDGPSCRPFHGWIDPASRKLVQVG